MYTVSRALNVLLFTVKLGHDKNTIHIIPTHSSKAYKNYSCKHVMVPHVPHKSTLPISEPNYILTYQALCLNGVVQHWLIASMIPYYQWLMPATRHP